MSSDRLGSIKPGNQWMKESGASSPGSRPQTVNYINITRRPEGGIVNVEMKRQQGVLTGGGDMDGFQGSSINPISSNFENMEENMVGGNGVLYGNSQHGRPGGSDYSSPRSSMGSGGCDSKGSSPRASIIINPPPLPTHHDHQRHGSPHSLLASPRSSISSLSIDSKHSSPRTSLTNLSSHFTFFDTKHPAFRTGGLLGEKFFGQRAHTVMSHPGFSGHDPTAARPHTLSLYERFNEPAPPPPYDARMRAQAGLHLAKVTVIPQSSAAPDRAGRKPEVHNIPIRVQGRNSSSPTPSVVYKIPINVVQSSSTAEPPRPTSQPITRIKGLHYDVIPPRPDGPSEAEKKLAVLTQQLENEMRITGNQFMKKPAPSDDSGPQTKSPPPYYGPHITGGVSNSYSGSPTSSGYSGGGSADGNSVAVDVSQGNHQMVAQVPVTGHKGVSEAEKKVDELTKELENRLESHPEGEYYGECYLTDSFDQSVKSLNR